MKHPTWLCTFTVMCDFPATAEISFMEGTVAHAVAKALAEAGYPGNVTAQLVSTQGNVSVLNPTPPLPVPGGPKASPI